MLRSLNSQLDTRWNAAPGQGDRLLSLDVFRGLTVAAMVLVTGPGTYSYTYPQLRHAAWDGATATDMIFPSFLFIVGLSLTLSLARRLQRGEDRWAMLWHLVARAVLLIVLGLMVNGFPTYDWLALRLPGILQRIALCTFMAGGLYIFLLPEENVVSDAPRRRVGVLAGVTGALLAVYWVLLKMVSVPGIGAGHLDPYGNLPAYIDRAVFTVPHLWPWGKAPGMGVSYDPEGLLSTMGALVCTLFGMLTGEWLRSDERQWRKVVELLLAAALLILAGWLFGLWMPINKSLFTPSFALLSSGVALALFVFFWVTVDLWRTRGWTIAGLVFGTNAILAFVLSSVLTTMSDRVTFDVSDGSKISLRHWIDEHWFATWLSPLHASLAYAIAVVLLNMLLIYPLYRKKFFLKL